ncbi:TPM domain-containing protein [Ralstonia soli]|uniref:TPM domain-containing protein n=1 Tax=Ralstonia soli TaxID=2953896 RepID=A0ABT1AJP8_9RALS|nr:TPM domain-containing protein [Ralstonia soli]MCO5398521.1 TPM domain-containing protein [Ralstonia soli]
MASKPRHHRGARRALAHLLTTPLRARRAFPAADLHKLEAAVRDGEQRHRGEVRVVIESALPVRDAWAGVTPRQRARTLFGLLEVWNTREHVGVLLYINLADHAVEILADHGIAAKVDAQAWRAICETITRGFAQRVTIAPVLDALAQINDLLAAHVPSDGTPRANELSDRPVVL